MAGVSTDEEAGAADATVSALMFAKYLHDYNKSIYVYRAAMFWIMPRMSISDDQSSSTTASVV